MTIVEHESAAAIARPRVTWAESFRTWCRVAALSFGGPAGQIAVMHRIVVDEKKWISEDRFLHALNYCMVLPGPEAQQLATYIGWLLHGTRGGLMAGVLFVLPGFVCMLVLSVLYALGQGSPLLGAVFFGLKAAVLAVVIEAVLRISRKVLRNPAMVMLAACSFVAVFFLGVPFPLIVLGAAAIGLIGGRIAPATFHVLKGHARGSRKAESEVDLAEVPLHSQPTPSWIRTVVLLLVFGALWFGPILALGGLFGPDSVFVSQGLFFSKTAVVTFGGAYAVLTYVAQQAAERFGWVTAGEMLDGLGLAETTPGPLIMVLQFVGFLGAYRDPGILTPLQAGLLGSVLTTWVTFVPCFLWIFLGATYIERLRANQSLTAALTAITAAVVGVVLNLGVWFALHALFREVADLKWGPLRLHVPSLSSLDPSAVALTALALVLTFILKRRMLETLAACTAAGIGLWLFGRL